MKNIIKNERGVSLISLAVAIIIIGIITGMLLYNVKDTKDIERLTNMYSDVENITDRVSNYYSRYGALPVLKNIDLSSESTINNWISELQSANNNGPLGANDSDNFYVIDLKALDNLTLNYGSGYSKLTNESTTLTDKDVYIINEKSHNVFLLSGIKVNNNGNIKTYYTNKEKDIDPVNIKYVSGIKIPDGFIYKSGSTKNDLKVEKVISGGTNIEYTWANTEDKVYTITELENKYYLNDSANHSNEIIFDSANGQNIDDLALSAREFGGFYYTAGSASNTVNVNYFSVVEDDNWGDVYKTTAVYTDINGDTAYIPVGFKISKLSSLNTINKGLVIKNNSTGDEYVWIDVPDSILANAGTLEEIENALKEYTKDYRKEGYEDNYYDGLVMTNDPNKNNKVVYNDLKNKMLQSIKTNGGFYIGRYEAGIPTANARTGKGSISSELVPLSKKNLAPINYVTCSQAQELASRVAVNGCTSTLMFGLQWDLVCKFFEKNGDLTYADIAQNSASWGNYTGVGFNVNDEAKSYNSSTGEYESLTDNYKPTGSKLLTTGATMGAINNNKRNSKLNIHDIAGNENEWTLEYNSNSNSEPCCFRGGYFGNGGNAYQAYKHLYGNVSRSDDLIGFRVTLFQTPTE